MVLKRSLGVGEEEGFTVANHEAKRRITSSNLAQNLICGFSSQELSLILEPLIRRCVREEVQRSCQSFFCTLPRSPLDAIEPSRKTSLQLRFLGNLSNTFFTGSRIESDDNTPLKLVLFDVNANRIVSSGPLSSLKIEIVPLDGDFVTDEEQDWSEKDFDSKIICARDGRRPLIAGNLVVTLENGVKEINELCFTDNSSWRRSRKFIIGARAKDASGRVRVREARSQAFMVKDHRGESYKKHHPPSLGDEIWRLEKIAKDGVFHKRLASHRICTVKDFLQMYITNQSLLRKLLGGSSNKTWETIIKHAKACVLDEKLYMYRCGPQGIGLLVDSILEVVGATFDGQNYLPLDKLPVFQMPMVESLKQQVYQNLNGMIPMDDLSVIGAPVPMANLHNYPLKSASLALPCVDIPLLHQDEVEMHMYGVVGSTSSEEEYFSPNLRNSFKTKEFMNGGGYGDDFNFQSLWQGDELYFDPNNQSIDIGICFSRNGSPRARWCKIRAALKWGSVRRDVAAKKMARLPSYLDFSV
ncbi:calmodulin-binding protein 60 B isoform X2 [Lactuca sativa]|uniref:Uncharacterized protein n=1 Tax=Lactuca sativa TaxID=4236 RepID=A0A9R1UFK3_LACSA|nr:calmodulin-binding protein 60 B isoform X2 [Lactuca sativa]KAJ0186222.1 hypothetical protein LSAT_V11C900505560 [Lactuca sativa]